MLSHLDQLLLQWMVREGKDMFNLQANASEISDGIMADLDRKLSDIGLSMTGFQINSVSYPEEIQEMINKVASQSMVGDMNRYQQMAVLDSMTNGSAQGGQMAADLASMQMGMMMGQQIMNQMTQTQQGAGINPSAAAGTGVAPAGQPGTGMNGGAAPSNSSPASATSSAPETGAAVSGTGAYPNFCPNCGQKTDGANFCSNCGQKLK